jgi:MinD superfamily P-loop ATPase
MKCEGCGACLLVCPQEAIELNDVITGRVSVENCKEGTFAHALLDIGAEGSGKLVTKVRKTLEKYEKDEEYVLIDGSPGIGCVVIASITGTDAAVIVTEPTMSGKSDMERVMKVVEHFGVKPFVCINKYDLNIDISREIEDYCERNNIMVAARIPFDSEITEALKNFMTPVEAGNKVFTDEILNMWSTITNNL